MPAATRTFGVRRPTVRAVRDGTHRATTAMPYNGSIAHPFQPPQEDRHDQQADPAYDGRRETSPVSRLPPQGRHAELPSPGPGGHQAILRRHLGSGDTTIVLSEIPVRWSPGQTEGHRIPDLLIAFDVDFNLAVVQMGYSIRDQVKPPDFVLEIASPSTGRRDYTRKRNDYAAFGIPEYWRFDPSGGQHHDAPLAGDQLVEGRTSPSRYGRQGRVTSTPGGYCGITNNPTRRAGEHRRAGRKGAMRLVGRRTTRAGARAWEGRMGCHKQKPRGGR